jgi:hypothetical protein
MRHLLQNFIGEMMRTELAALRDALTVSLEESSRVKILNKSPIYIISPIFFHLHRAENGIGDRSAGEHLKNLKCSRGSWLDLEISIFAKTFQFYLVAQS